jgi:hypothetical protein
VTGKRVQFEEETWAAVDARARESKREFQELADEAFRDLLAKHGQPVGLKDQLKRSLKESVGAETAPGPARRRTKAKS